MSDDIEELKRLEEELSKLESSSADSVSPKTMDKDNLLKLFRDLISSDDSKKFANVDSSDIYDARSFIDVALYAEAEDLGIVSAYLETKAENIFATSLGKKGFFAQLLVTQIKKEQKMVTSPEKSKGWSFSKKKQEDTENE
jgi:hypothetical protein